MDRRQFLKVTVAGVALPFLGSADALTEAPQNGGTVLEIVFAGGRVEFLDLGEGFFHHDFENGCVRYYVEAPEIVFEANEKCTVEEATFVFQRGLFFVDEPFRLPINSGMLPLFLSKGSTITFCMPRPLLTME